MCRGRGVEDARLESRPTPQPVSRGLSFWPGFARSLPAPSNPCSWRPCWLRLIYPSLALGLPRTGPPHPGRHLCAQPPLSQPAGFTLVFLSLVRLGRRRNASLTENAMRRFFEGFSPNPNPRRLIADHPHQRRGRTDAGRERSGTPRRRGTSEESGVHPRFATVPRACGSFSVSAFGAGILGSAEIPEGSGAERVAKTQPRGYALLRFSSLTRTRFALASQEEREGC